jgi:hypothetical protein
MRSIKLLAAAAVVAALVAGPVMAQDATCPTGKHMSTKTNKCVTNKKTHKSHKKTTTAPAADPAMTPAQ